METDVKTMEKPKKSAPVRSSKNKDPKKVGQTGKYATICAGIIIIAGACIGTQALRVVHRQYLAEHPEEEYSYEDEYYDYDYEDYYEDEDYDYEEDYDSSFDYEGYDEYLKDFSARVVADEINTLTIDGKDITVGKTTLADLLDAGLIDKSASCYFDTKFGAVWPNGYDYGYTISFVSGNCDNLESGCINDLSSLADCYVYEVYFYSTDQLDVDYLGFSNSFSNEALKKKLDGYEYEYFHSENDNIDYYEYELEKGINIDYTENHSDNYDDYQTISVSASDVFSFY